MQKARVKAYENSYNRHRDAKLKVKIEKKEIVSFGSMKNLVQMSMSKITSVVSKKPEIELDEG